MFQVDPSQRYLTVIHEVTGGRAARAAASSVSIVFRTPLAYLILVPAALAAGVVAPPVEPAAPPYAFAWASMMQSVQVAPRDTVPAPSRPAGALNRRTRALQSRLGRGTGLPAVDSLSTRKRDSLAAVPRDSSARIAQFVKEREDGVNALDKLAPEHPLYLHDPPSVRVDVALDTTQWIYTLRYVVGTTEIRAPVVLPLDAYAEVRLDYALRQNWDQLIQATGGTYQKKEGLGELFGKVTNIEIPVPKNPLFSIFGPPIIVMHINGSVNVHAAFRNTKNDQFVNSPLGQSRNEPDFKQEVQVNLKGEIGDKLKISADWNTQRTFEYENQLKVAYTGYPDEIVQSVEAGNVSLPTSSSFIPPSQALFGILAKFQLGPLRLTTVASQKKGQIKELTVSGGARPTPFERRPTDYSKDHYFIDTSYINLYERIYYDIPAQIDPNMTIQEIEVWVTSTTTFDARDRNIVAFMNTDSVLQKMNDEAARTQEYDVIPGEVEVGKFTQLTEGTDFTYNPNAGIITINKSLQPDQAVAASFTLQRQPTPLYVGNFGSRDTATSKLLVMKLVRPRNLQPQFKAAWRMLVKNRYPLGGRGIKELGFEFHVEYLRSGDTPLQNVLPENVNLLEMFGLDRYKSDGQAGRDETFDYLPGITIDDSRGEVIFPTLEPFSAASIKRLLMVRGLSEAAAQTAADSFAFEAIYDTTYNGATNDRHNLFHFIGNITPSTASTYNLGFNIVEGSVEVLVDGQRATPNVDYSVDYITGLVVVKNQSLLVPGRNLQIRYEANDLFQLASKTLLGARGDIDVSKDTKLGFTFMNLNQQSLSDKVRLGEEPISNTIMGFDGGTTFDTPFLTRALNWLPGIATAAPSQFSIRGEAAYMSPDPNTRKSPIPQDGGKGIAYIDDFEGAKRTIPLGVASTGWKDASLPFYVPGLDPYSPPPGTDTALSTSDPSIRAQLLPDSTKLQYKGLATWFTVPRSDVYVQDIWGNRKSVSRSQEQVTVMNILFQPAQRGEYNYSLNLEGTVRGQPQKAWAGIQRLLGTTSSNLLDENISFIELWINIVETSPNTVLRFNLGYISEDVIPNRILDTEDGLDGGIRNGTLNSEVEDVGLDGANDAKEAAEHQAFLTQYPEYANDPAGDNWLRTPIDLAVATLDEASALEFLGGTGTENNRDSELGRRFPDTEDLNGNNVLDRVNSYYEYELPLDTNTAGFQKFVVGQGENGWYQVRIPLNKYARQIGTPSFTNVEGVRLWLSGATSNVLFRVAEFNLIGNQWEELRRNDPTFKVSTVNYEDNPSYTIPPGVVRERDRTRPDENILGNEQSLNLILENVPDGQSRQAIRRYAIRPLDLFSYRIMKMFVHGETRPGLAVHYVDTTNYDAEVFVRFGSDSLNYYEYRAPIRPDWDPLNDISIRFSDLTAIKLVRDSARALTKRFPVPGGPPGSTYQILGEPTLSRVTYMTVGVENPANKGVAYLTGETWVNELRLTDVDDTPGWAYRFDSQVKLADVASVQFSRSTRDPFFHGLEDRFGTRLQRTDWTLTANASLEKLLPESWTGSVLAFSYSHVEGLQDPRYLTGTDILVDAAAARIDNDTSTTATRLAPTGRALRTQSQTLTIAESYAVPTIKLNLPSKAWWVTETINRMTLGFNYATNTSRSPAVLFSRSWSWSGRFSYALPFGPTTYVEPFSTLGEFFLFSPWKKARFYYTPRQLSMSASLTRSNARSQARNQALENPVNRNFGANRSFAFSWQVADNSFLSPSFDYQVDITSNLTHLETDRYGRQRSFFDILNDLILSDRLIGFGTDLQYGQTINVTTKPAVPEIFKLDKILTPSLRYSTRYDWNRNVQAGLLGRAAGWNATITSGLDINVKTIGEQIWGPPPVVVPGDSSKRGSFAGIAQLTRTLIKSTLFDFDRLSLSFTQRNRAQNNGVLGRPGFANVFSRVPFLQGSDVEDGPSLLYQLGLSSDPHGQVVVAGGGGFPFFHGETRPGLRAPNGQLTDLFGQVNTVSLRTSRPLWEGAQLELTWNVGWSYSMTRNLKTDSLGVPTVLSRTVSGDVDRSFVTLPPVLLFKLFKTGIEDVNKRFVRLRTDRGDVRPEDAKISQAFEEGMEAFPLISRILGSFAPRVNWSIRWDGLERMSLFKSFATRVSLDHSYTSNFRRRWHLTPSGVETTDGETIAYQFAPLIGLNVSFKEVAKGTLGAQIRYSTSSSYDLTPSVQNIVEGTTSEISVSATYAKQGFEFPLFGLSLSNDLNTTLTYSLQKNSRKLYNLKEDFKPDGQPLEGQSRTVIEPRIRYILSSRVTASLYYRYIKTAPDAAGSKITGSTINEGGLDVTVAIQ